MNERITDAELTSLLNTRTEQEWDTVCTAIKAARGGAYPVDWWPKVALSGLMARKQALFSQQGPAKESSIPGFATITIEAPEADPVLAARLEADLRRRGY